MITRIKNKIDGELIKFVHSINKAYSLEKISPLLHRCIKDFILRPGKRIRPILFVVGYLGFAKKVAPHLYRSAISIELLHDFLLVHDDIIDKSDTRRNKPSMHKMLNNHLASYGNIKFNGQDLAIVVGDIMYAMAINAFMSIGEDLERKEKALKTFTRAAMLTGCGEFLELLNGVKDIKNTTKQDIYKIYDYKTAHYTFACPLSVGALLAGAKQNQIDKLFACGIYLGRAFQIKDDILGIFGNENKIGKSTLSDIQEAKKTMLIWYAYNHTNKNNKSSIRKTFSKKKVNNSDLLLMRTIIEESGSLSYVQKEISRIINKTQDIILSTQMSSKYKNFLCDYSRQLLTL